MSRTSSLPNLFVVGTDTAVGKTVVSLLIMQWLFAQGHRPFYVKPFQTGCRDPYDVDSDAAFVYRHTPQLQGQDPAQSVVCCYPEPKAPYIAARNANRAIDLDAVCDTIARMSTLHTPLVIEAAGGLLVPVTEKKMIIDVAARIACRPLLVARAGLGTINHTLLSVEALRHRGIEPIGVILVESESQPADHDLFAENIDLIQKKGRLPVEGSIPRITDFSAPPASASAIVQKLLNPIRTVA